MEQKENFTEINEEYIKEIYECAMKYFGEGIYVKQEEGHPCRWDFISFKQIDNEDDEYDDCNLDNYTFEHSDISDCCGSEEFVGRTLDAVIRLVGMKGWCFELNGVDYLE